MERFFEGQVALVTGGGKGIGLAIAQALADRGARVAVTGRNLGTLQQAVRILATEGLALAMDVRDQASVEVGVGQVAAWGGRLDLVVNNAGLGLIMTPLGQTSPQAWRDVLETNLTGAFLVTRAAWPHLVASRGQVLNVSSIAGTQGFHGSSAYSASKFGLNGFTEVLKLEGQPLGVRALSLCPGSVDTDIWSDLASAEQRARMLTAAQVAKVAVEALAAPRNMEFANPLVVTNAESPFA
ncbi:MAG: SDR family NAD(P)-dependent oxidoreductase [Fimbriimonadaceae bacterium]|nr:SDR family NAD(P)-dependent oxidoreductase [Fimbriimonadaceae bacterium]QYK55543.1 MAG: SDR family NAD(P)-dependent oxidoreductase [Fimbriimonadaceae bacterium]